MFPEPILSSSQLPGSLVLLESDSICLNDAHTPPTRYILIIIIKNNKCFLKLIRLEAGREFNKKNKREKGETESEGKETAYTEAGMLHCEITQKSEGPVFKKVVALRRKESCMDLKINGIPWFLFLPL